MTTNTTTHANDTNPGWARSLCTTLFLVVAMAASSGCAFMDGLTQSMIDAGILKPQGERALYIAGVDGEAVVEVRTGSDRGVGVAVEGGLILTSAHVVEGHETVTVVQPSLVAGGVGTRVPGTVIWTDTQHDLCLIAPQDSHATGETASPKHGKAWLITLNGSGHSLSGRESRRTTVQRVTLAPGDRIVMDGKLRHGDSGSPLVQDGCVVGVVRTATRFARVDPAVAVLKQRENGSGAMVASAARGLPARSY